jgi:class 3 adenylate cyclase
MLDAVHEVESTVNQVMGDGIMALFGAPIAHERPRPSARATPRFECISQQINEGLHERSRLLRRDLTPR